MSSVQIIATSHDLTPKSSWCQEIPLFPTTVSVWWNTIIWSTKTLRVEGHQSARCAGHGRWSSWLAASNWRESQGSPGDLFSQLPHRCRGGIPDPFLYEGVGFFPIKRYVQLSFLIGFCVEIWNKRLQKRNETWTMKIQDVFHCISFCNVWLPNLAEEEKLCALRSKSSI